MTTIDDSNTHDSSDAPPYFWFGEISARLRARTRDEIHELDLGRRGWRVLHTLADGPATADELYASLPHRGRRGRPFGDRPSGDRPSGDRPAEADARPDGDAPSNDETHAASAPREWRGRPDWMRREWERRQQMYRAWMEHDSSRAQGGLQAHEGHDHGDHHVGHDHGNDQLGRPDNEHEHEGHEHDDHEHNHGDHDHDHAHDHDDHDHAHHHPHHDHHGAEQAFERGFERGFLRGVERGGPFGHAGHGFGPGGSGYGGFGYGGFGPGRYGRGFGPGRFGPGAWGPEHVGHGRPPFVGRDAYNGLCRGGVDRILADFVERGWVWFDGDRATLTDEGRAAHDAAAERIHAVRAKVTEGIDAADLATTLATLEAMARNLGWTPPAAPNDGTGDGIPAGADSIESTDIDEGTAAD